MEILGWLQDALMDFRAYAILVLIVMNALLAVGAAIFKTKNFDPERLAEFYKTNVLPYFLGYVAFFIGIKALEAGLVKVELYGKFDWLLDPGVLWLAWLALVGTIGNSIAESVLVLYGGDLLERAKAKMGK